MYYLTRALQDIFVRRSFETVNSSVSLTFEDIRTAADFWSVSIGITCNEMFTFHILLLNHEHIDVFVKCTDLLFYMKEID